MPTGIPGCIEYYSENNCRKCTTDLYLHNNQCAPVPLNNLIENCNYYQDAFTCDTCIDSFVLDGNECVLPKVECLTYYNSEECQTCSPDRAIFIESGKRVCKVFTPISLCQSYTLQ